MFQTGRETETFSSANRRIKLRRNDSRVGNIAPIRPNRITVSGDRSGFCGGVD
jgi:hypothetical protein